MLRRLFRQSKILNKVIESAETVQAAVNGGWYAPAEVSGSTITYISKTLPIQVVLFKN